MCARASEGMNVREGILFPCQFYLWMVDLIINYRTHGIRTLLIYLFCSLWHPGYNLSAFSFIGNLTTIVVFNNHSLNDILAAY